jgi:hypothetical protein
MNGDVHGEGGFSGATLRVTDGDNHWFDSLFFFRVLFESRLELF